MSRLSKAVVETRENFVRELFRTNLALTGVQVQTKLKEQFGKIMRPNRIYELKHEVALQSVPVLTETQTGSTSTQALTSTDVTEAYGTGTVNVDSQVSAE